MGHEGVELSLRTGIETWDWGTWLATAFVNSHREEVDGGACKEVVLPAHHVHQKLCSPVTGCTCF